MTVTADEGTVGEVAQIVGHEVRDTDLLGVTRPGTALARAARRRLRELHARHRSPGRSGSTLRLPCAAAHLGRRRLLSDRRGRCRVPEAAGRLPSRHQLARRAFEYALVRAYWPLSRTRTVPLAGARRMATPRDFSEPAGHIVASLTFMPDRDSDVSGRFGAKPTARGSRHMRRASV